MASMQRPETFHLSLQEQTELPHQVQVALQSIENLKYFLATAPVHFLPEQQIKRFLLPTGEYVSCVLWNGLYHVTGTDIVRCLAFRFSAFGRPVRNAKKFEEGVFSDLRNLKDGNDATLQDPKSAFLDFLYKNNCIRTQKKQKVFYWYSVNYDRLFLDALERDLKREKAGTEPTTEACSEPALSYHWDPSISLWDQVNSKISGAQPGGYGDGQDVYSRSVSPSGLRAASAARDSMPPPAMIPSAVSHPPMEPFGDMTPYNHPMVATSNPMQMGNNSTGLMADNGMSMSQPRHASMPASYMEPSPAPSFVSSQGHYDDYSTRGLSYEPITPPQQLNHNSSDNHYSGQPESSFAGSAHGPMYGSMPPPSTSASGGYRNWTHASTNPMLSHIEGSPNYMQHRKRASIGGAYGSTGPSPVQFSRNYMGRRPSDLRRAVSVGLTDGQHPQHQRAVSNPPPQTFGHLQDYRDGSISREGTPVSTIEEFQTMDVYGNYTAGNNHMLGAYGSSPMSTAGAVRRARSATTSEMAAPYPHKTHTCPIPNCSRHFKRLEHLKRHVRTHTQERPFVCQLCNKAFSRSDNLAQHRRTHENGDNSQLNASFTEDEFSQGEGGPIINVEDDVDGHSGFDLSVDAQDSFHSLNAFNNAAAVMGPPPLPTAMANV